MLPVRAASLGGGRPVPTRCTSAEAYGVVVAEIEVGDVLETVLLGSFLDGVLRIWRGDGRAECRRVVTPRPLSQSLALGVLARTSPEPNRFREVALLDEMRATLVLMERPRADGDEDRAAAGSLPLAAELCEAPAVADETWVGWGRWLGTAIVAAAERGEYVVVETGGWEAIREPYALAGVLPGPNGEALSYIEAAPAPTLPPWPPQEGASGGSVSAPATAESLGVAGILAAQAVALWARTPLDAVLTFGRYPRAAT